jgi:tetratricopeptide (TPR) repeat protein
MSESTPENAPQPSPEPEASLQITLPDESTDRDRLLWSAVIVLMTLIAYMPAMWGDFLWDDTRHVSKNPLLEDLNGLQRIWFGVLTEKINSYTEPPKAGETVYPLPQYYPLTHTVFWIQRQLWEHPTGFHVLLHAGSALLLWRLLLMWKVPGAYVAAAIFALHPVNVESVAWISELKNVLSLILALGSIYYFWQYLDAAEGKSDQKDLPQWYAISLALFVGALLSKTVTASVPAALILLMWWQRRLSRRAAAMLIPYFVLGLIASRITTYMEVHHVGAQGEPWDFSWAERILIAGRAVWFYLSKILAPVNLSFVYEKWSIDPSRLWLWIFPAGAVLALGVLWLRRGVWGRGPLVAALLFAGVLLPALGFFNVYPMRYAYAADHFQYMAMISIVVGLVYLGHALITRLTAETQRVPTAIAVSAVVLLVLGSLSAVRARVFEHNGTLWEDTIKKNPTSPMPRGNLAEFLMEQAALVESQGERDAARAIRESARKEAEGALAIDPDNAVATAIIGNIELSEGNYEEALRHHLRAHELNPRMPQALQGATRALLALQRYPEARDTAEKALDLQSESATALHLKIRALLGIWESMPDGVDKDRVLVDALNSYSKITRLYPADLRWAHVRREFGTLLARIGERDLAIEQLRAYVDMMQENTEAEVWAQLGFLMGERNDFAAAERCFRAALAIDPENEIAQRGMELIRATTRPSATAPALQAPATAPAASE